MDWFYVCVFGIWFFIGIGNLLGEKITKFNYGIMWGMVLAMLARAATAKFWQ